MQSTARKGAFELTFIEQMSRSLERFRQDAEKYAKIVKGKSPQEVEKLVSSKIHNKRVVLVVLEVTQK